MCAVAAGSPEPNDGSQPSAPASAVTPTVDLESLLNDLEPPDDDKLDFDDVLDILGPSFDATAPDASWGKPIPIGKYLAILLGGELIRSKKKQTPAYALNLKICEGEHTGHLLSMPMWMTKESLGRVKFQVHKLGVFEFRQLKNPLPAGFKLEIEVGVDATNRWNEVRDFRVVQSPGGGSGAASVEMQG